MKKLFLILLPCLIMLILLMLFSGKYLILGGEGNFITDFQLTKSIGTYTWVPLIYGTGFPVGILNHLVGIFDFFAFLQGLGLSIKTVNIISILLAYTLPFLSMLWLMRRILKADFAVAYLISLFYVINPLFIYHMHSLMFWNLAPLFVFPLFFGCIYKYYFSPGRLFLFFGLLTALLSFALSNVPFLGVFQIWMVISIIIIPFMQDIKIDFKMMVKNFLTLESSFILFNAWWLINLVRFNAQDLSTYFPKDFAIQWISQNASIKSDMLMRLLSLTGRITKADINFFTDLYFSPLFLIILFIPFFLIIASLLKDWQNTKYKKYPLAVFLFILIVLFLNKGVSQPFGELYAWMIENIPFFYIFKTPLEKFGPPLLFLISLALLPVFNSKAKKWVYGLLIVYLIAGSVPYFSLNFTPDYALTSDANGKPAGWITKKYIYKENDFNAIQTINKNKLDYRYVSLPGSLNYQETILNHDGNKYYRGMNPFLHATNKPFIAAYSPPTLDFFYSIFHNFNNHAALEGSLNIYGVKKIVFNQDIQGSFGFMEPESKEELFHILSRQYEKEEFGPITIFNRKQYLPHFFTANSIIPSAETRDVIPQIVTDPDYQARSVIYFQSDNSAENNDRVKNLKIGSLSTLEYKKINPIKYRVRVHQAKGEFPFVFSESFHQGWAIYLGDNPMVQPDLSNSLESYKILEDNFGEQANQDELRSYIDQGFITTLGDGQGKFIAHQELEGNKVKTKSVEEYTIDFVSKNFQGTIQNDNLPSGPLYETWLKKPVGSHDHLKSNGYANSWLLNANSICSGSSFCRQNQDGTYDFEIIVEFLPQRLFYLGLYISALTFLISLGILVYRHKRGKLYKRV